MVSLAQDHKTIEGLVNHKVLKLNQTASFENCVMHLGQRNDRVALVVNDNDRVVGLITTHELILALVNKVSKTATIKDIMHNNPPVVSPRDSLRQVAKAMTDCKLDYVAVVEDEIIKGIVSWHDIQASILEEFGRFEDQTLELGNQLRYKDDYLGVVSHDVRTPLSVVSLCCDYLMSESSRKTLTPDQVSFIERIKRNAKNATTMVSDILDVVRLEKGFDLDYGDVDVDEFLGDVISNLQVIASEKNIEVVVECEEHMHVPMDRKRMIHVLENLVNNAVKFSPSGKKIFVSASSEVRKGDTYLVLTVRDEGMGIKEEDQKKIFDKFSQLESGVAKTLGIGLGLAIAKKFVSLHRGFMEVDGGWQKGASFRAYIPGAKTGRKAESSEGERSDVPRILIVEDDESIREYFEEELRMAKYDVVSAHDGEEGIHAYFRYKPDLIMSDIRMPNVDGLELLARVRMTDKDVPFILCTGYYPGLSEDLAASDYKADHVLEKPVTADYVIKVVGQFVKPVQNAS
ncbi:ATP-binding protein [Pseudobacteriovorax antillogorgiicola]|uniref:histidine kinase n=1 Tax=Pseudobacteriovorax antillogorgiicola TaxID=1513793 RepID=A0A1Y6B9G5_9BACT|nr:ATP-binding protein [Pseudobacteriovorax antillogorgiicola]TCS58524.1 signal transduction histidine kinase [Pseudobacteriovorax antillogorgiicola]SME97988.1 Signal transduction histidine kinase [Pseudobacteriovorax antillogorgiicola]